MDDTERIAALESRVADLEGRLERLTRAPWDSFSCREFRLVDSEGELRGEWRLLAGEREPRLALYGEGGKPRVVLSVTLEGEPMIGIVDQHGRSRGALGTRGSTAFLTLRTPEGDRTVELIISPDTTSGLTFRAEP